jgi:hypothetical protein
LLFQPIDVKQKCIGYYADGSFYYDRVPAGFNQTWDYSDSLKNLSIEYGRVYAGGKSLTEVCPARYTNLWNAVKERWKAYIKSFKTAKLNLQEVCVYDLVPEYFLFEYCDLKNEITREVLQNYVRPANYDFMIDLLRLVGDIKKTPLNINMRAIRHKLGSVAGRNFAHRMRELQPVCDYNPWGTVTGRLTTMPNSFPIMTLNKQFRACLEPRHDWFLELDYNAAEIRTLLALGGHQQPEEDIHEWNIQHIYNPKTDREEAKKKFFSWMYSGRSHKQAEQYYNRELVLDKYWDGDTIVTDFNREIRNVDRHHALNYIVQSTTSDLVLSRAFEIARILSSLESRIAFTLHDSIVIDLKNEERAIIPTLMKEFGNTKFGNYKVNVAVGKNFGAMRKMNL